MRYLSLVVLLLLGACTSTGTHVEQEKLAAFVKGQTTYTEVIQQLGQPDQSEVKSNGTTTIMYIHKQSMGKAANFIPFVGGFIEGGAGADDTTVTITFDNKALLDSYAVSELDDNGVKRITKRR